MVRIWHAFPPRGSGKADHILQVFGFHSLHSCTTTEEPNHWIGYRIDEISHRRLGFLGLRSPTRPIGGQFPDSGRRALTNIQIDDPATLEMVQESPDLAQGYRTARQATLPQSWCPMALLSSIIFSRIELVFSFQVDSPMSAGCRLGRPQHTYAAVCSAMLIAHQLRIEERRLLKAKTRKINSN